MREAPPFFSLHDAAVRTMNNFRERALQKRRELDVDYRALASKVICDKVTQSRLFGAASRVACYLPMRDEVDTLPIIYRAWRANKRVFVPTTRGGGEMFFREFRQNTPLRQTRLSIWEPESGEFMSPRLLQLVITPTVAFDAKKNRIGMGGGYYDRCFSFLRHRNHWLQPKLVGVAYKCQPWQHVCNRFDG